MATVCDCNATLGNSGTPGCVNIPNVTYKLIIVPTTDSTGARNKITTTDTLDATYFDDRINAGISGATLTDANQRWFPIGAFKNVEDVRGDDITEDFNDGDIAFIQEGTRTFTGIIIDRPSPTLLGKIKSWRCSDISAFIVDIDGNLYGNGEDVDTLYPFKLNSESWSPKFMKTVDAAVARLQIDFSYSKDEADEDIKMIMADETTPDVRDLVGLQDVTAVITAPAVAGFTATLTGSYGTAVSANLIKGLVLADFDVNETSPTPAPEPLASVTETSDGVYDFVYTTPVASGDVLSLDLQKNGFEMTTAVITTP